MQIDRPGVYTMTAEEYHADPCPEPSLSASVAHLLLTRTARHARAAHPRLNPEYVPRHSSRMDRGAAAHALLLEMNERVKVIEADSWRPAAARQERDAAWEQGHVALLAPEWEKVQDMVEVARAELPAWEERPAPLADGTPERTLIWQEGVVWCRSRLDWLHRGDEWIDDYKTTENANPAEWSRGALFRLGHDLQAAFYLRGVKVLLGKDAEFRFVLQDIEPPFALSSVRLSQEVLALAERKRHRAVALWGECLNLAPERWPTYARRSFWAEAPPWEMAWLASDVEGTGDDRPLADQLFGERGA